MSPWLKYLLGRLGLFLVVFLAVLPLPQLSLPVKMLVALVASFALSWFLLRRWRDEASANMAAAVERRRAQKQQLRSALAGEDEAGAGPDASPR